MWTGQDFILKQHEGLHGQAASAFTDSDTAEAVDRYTGGVHVIFPALLPGWQGEARSPLELPFPLRVRLALAVSFLLARPLCWWITGGPLQERAGELVERLSHHERPLARSLVEGWKLVAVMTA